MMILLISKNLVRFKGNHLVVSPVLSEYKNYQIILNENFCSRIRLYP
jgi:hypothetical protein